MDIINTTSIYSNLQCYTGMLCVDVDLELASAFTDNIENDFYFESCQTTQLVEFNTTLLTQPSNTTTYCITWAREDITDATTRNCGLVDSYLEGDFAKINYTVNSFLDSKFKTGDNSFSNIVTFDQKIFVQPLNCSYTAQGNILSRNSWMYIPTDQAEEVPETGSGSFNVTFFMSQDEECETELAAMDPSKSMIMCITLSGISDPTIKLVVNRVWATPGSDPNHAINKIYFDQACWFGDEDHDTGDGAAVEHDVTEKIVTPIDLGRPSKFNGYPSINYHLDIEIAMNADKFPSCQEVEEDAENLQVQHNRNGVNNQTIYQRNGNLADFMKTLGPKVTSLQKFEWLLKNRLDTNTNLPSLYEYLDDRMEEIRLENKRKGVFGKILQIDEAGLINDYQKMVHRIKANEDQYSGRGKRSALEVSSVAEKYTSLPKTNNFDEYRKTGSNDYPESIVAFGNLFVNELPTGSRRVISVGPLYFINSGLLDGPLDISVFMVCAIILCFLSFVALIVVVLHKIYRSYTKV